MNISHVLNVKNTGPERMEGFQYLQVRTSNYGETALFTVQSDDQQEKSVFDLCYEFIEGGRSSNGKILVHCHAGQNRSGTIVIAYVMKHLNMSLLQAINHVRCRRGQVSPHRKYIQQLAEYEQVLRGQSSLDPNTFSINPISTFFAKIWN